MRRRWAGSCCPRAPATLVFGCRIWESGFSFAHLNGARGGSRTGCGPDVSEAPDPLGVQRAVPAADATNSRAPPAARPRPSRLARATPAIRAPGYTRGTPRRRRRGSTPACGSRESTGRHPKLPSRTSTYSAPSIVRQHGTIPHRSELEQKPSIGCPRRHQSARHGLQSFLLKKGGSVVGLRRNWKRRWFLLENDTCELHYYADPSLNDQKGTVRLSAKSSVRVPETVSMRGRHRPKPGEATHYFELWDVTDAHDASW